MQSKKMHVYPDLSIEDVLKQSVHGLQQWYDETSEKSQKLIEYIKKNEEQFYCITKKYFGEEYENIVKEIKRISIEFDKPFTTKKYNKIWNDAINVGKDLYKLGESWDEPIKFGEPLVCTIEYEGKRLHIDRTQLVLYGDGLMLFTMAYFVLPYLKQHMWFWDRAFDGNGKCLWQKLVLIGDGVPCNKELAKMKDMPLEKFYTEETIIYRN
tara:strand:- start:49 stop:681 length:633 start_codon:yes stop_codon:yes gene_type:complete